MKQKPTFKNKDLLSLVDLENFVFCQLFVINTMSISILLSVCCHQQHISQGRHYFIAFTFTDLLQNYIYVIQ